MFKEIVDDARRTPDIGRSRKLTMSTLCSGELKRQKIALFSNDMHKWIKEIFMPQRQKIGGNLFYRGPSVCLSGCPKLIVKTSHFSVTPKLSKPQNSSLVSEYVSLMHI